MKVDRTRVGQCADYTAIDREIKQSSKKGRPRRCRGGAQPTLVAGIEQ
jgi:hypothetical protein